ncbi:MAG: TetR/AcrR family transcriptional regulator [Terriglobales bacterium]
MSPGKSTPGESRRDILRAAARLFQERGYDATSMQDVASALNFSKAALYHHFESKEQILFEIMSYGMDVFEEKVLAGVAGIADPEERLRAVVERHVELVLSGHDREISVILHENRTLPAEAGRQINARKKHYMVYLGELVAEVQQRRGLKRPEVDAHLAAMALLGMMNWMYQWYRPEGGMSAAEIARQYIEIFFRGAIPPAVG